MSDDTFRHYQPAHELTPTYLNGMQAIAAGSLQEAVSILTSEPEDSPCYGLAIGNAALSLIRLDQREKGENLARKAATKMQLTGCPHPPSGVQILRNLAEAIAGQGRSAESLPHFNSACLTADALIAKHPDFATDIELEKAHTLNSWGAAHLNLRQYPVAINIFNAAREIYRTHAGINSIGISEVLTNCAHAYRLLEKFTEAEFSLIEALKYAKEMDSKDQIFRVQLALIQIGSSSLPELEAYSILELAANECESSGRFSAAYLRRAIAASWAAETGKTTFGLSMIEKAKTLETHLEASDPNPPRLRMTETQLLIQNNAPKDDVIHTLIQGAHLWYAQLGPRLIDGDVQATTSEMHEHFRLLARKLLDVRRIPESLVAFEAGRALSYAIEVEPALLNEVGSINPFSADGKTIALTSLHRTQKVLSPDEVIVAFSILPPDVIAFIISSDAVAAIFEPLPDTLDGCEALFKEIDAIPTRLHAGVGARAIPDLIQKLTTQLKSNVGLRKVSALMPYSRLHSVPWRMILRNAGVPWNQLQFGTEFGLMLRTQGNGPGPKLPLKFLALGNGYAETIDLNEEARLFVAALGASATLTEQCTRQHLTDALQQDAAVLISCHGSVNPRIYDGQLVLALNDGDFPVGSIFPPHVKAPLVILSACESGVYGMHWSDYPLGAAPELIRLGAEACIGTRFSIGARFASDFIDAFSSLVKAQPNIARTFCGALELTEQKGADSWKDLACLELLVRRK